MSLFVNKDKILKSPRVMYAFFLSLFFMVIFGMLYATLAEPLYNLISIANHPRLTGFLQCLVVSVLGVPICCLFFMLKDKRLVPMGFAFFGLMTILFYVSIFLLTPESREIALTLVTLYFPIPAILGSITTWSIYRYYFRKKDKEIIGD